MIDQKQRRVLIVHDEPVFTARMNITLRTLGFLIDSAIDGQAALRRVLEDPPDVVCVSLNLPRDSGYDLCEVIRKSHSLNHVKILVISDRQSPEIVAYAEEAGADAFLKRPFKKEQLAACMTTMLQNSQSLQVEASRDITNSALALG